MIKETRIKIHSDKITNDINNKIYIGQTVNTIEKRWRQHKCNSTKEYFSQVVLYKAINKSPSFAVFSA